MVNVRDNAEITNFGGIHADNYSIFCYNYHVMAKIVLAVSGGVDSMTLLDLLPPSPELVVAHFDHGIRPNSAEDASFVEQAAQVHNLEFQLGRAELNEGASEATARAARYEFLWQVAAEDSSAPSEIWTAHHLDDLVETVAINLLRGTGWRGLAVLDAPGVRRPFLEPELLSNTDEPWDKAAIWRYAGERNLHFREDQTNSSDEYLRNRIRHKIDNSSGGSPDWSGKEQDGSGLERGTGQSLNYEQKKQLWDLWQQQKALKRTIDQIVAELLPSEGEPWPRAWFWELERRQSDQIQQTVALELLRAGTLRAGISATRPQLEQFRQAILSYAPGKYFNLPGDHLVKIAKNEFWL